MYRIVFYYCTILLLGTFVYSKPHELTELNHGNGNHLIYSVGQSQLQPVEQHEIIKEGPTIFDLSAQVAKFILYFIKKYCKNSDKIDYLENLLTKNGIESIFKTNPEGNIQANFEYFEENKRPHEERIKSTKPKLNVIEQQGHAIKFDLATAPNHELPTTTIKTETKQKELIRTVELTNGNIHVSKQYQTPKIQTIQQHEKQPIHYNSEKERQHPVPVPVPMPMPMPMHLNIENVQPKVAPSSSSYSYSIPKHIKPEIMEPMYEYASHGDDYGINNYEYALPDYDYSTSMHVKVPAVSEPKVSIGKTKEAHVLLQQSTSIPETWHQTKSQLLLPEHTYMQHSITPTTKPSNIINDWYKYITPEVSKIQQHEKQPKIHENTYEFKMPKHKLIIDKQEPHVVQIEFNRPTIKYQPEVVESKIRKVNIIEPEHTTTTTTTIKENIIPKADNKESGILSNLYKFIMPEEQTEHVEKYEEIAKQPNEYEFFMPTFEHYSIPEYQHETIPIVNHEQPQIKEHIFENPMPDTKQPDNWYQQEVEPKFEVNVKLPEVHFSGHQQPDVEQPLRKEDLFDFSMPNNWYKQDEEPKIKVNQEPEVHFIEHQQPDVEQPLRKEDHFDFTMPDNWYQQTVEPKIEVNQEPEVHFIDHQQPDVEQPFRKEDHFDFTMPDNLYQQTVKPKIEINQEPQVYFLDHNQPDVEQPLRKEDHFNFLMPDTWYQQSVEPKIEVNQEPEIHFIDHQQADLDQPLKKENHFDHLMPHYELNVETSPHIGDHFKEQESHFVDVSVPKEPEESGWFKYLMPKYEEEITPKIEGQTQVQFINQEPQFKEHTFEHTVPNVQQPDSNWFKYSIPEYQVEEERVPHIGMDANVNVQIPKYEQQQQYYMPHMYPEYHFNPNTKIDDNQHSTIAHTNYWMPNVQNKEFHLKIQNENNMPEGNLKNYADDIFQKYTMELQNLDKMKPHYEQTVPKPIYAQFAKNIDKMKDVLDVWKNGDKFYDIPNIEYVKKTMTNLSKDTLDLVQMDHTTPKIMTSQIHEISTMKATTTTTGTTILRRTLDGPEVISRYLQDPKRKQEFGTLDHVLQNVILAYIELGKEERTADSKQGFLMLLNKIKFIMTKYQNLFNQFEWIDQEIENLKKDVDIKMTPELEEFYNNNLFEDNLHLSRMDLSNRMNFDLNSNIFLTLLNIPVTAQSKDILKKYVYKLLKDIVDMSDIYPEFKKVKFYLGEQKFIETSPLYQRLIEFAASPKEFVEHAKSSLLENKFILKNGWTNDEEEEVENGLTTTTEAEVQETIIQSTIPKKKIEKHHNIFRKFLMNTDD